MLKVRCHAHATLDAKGRLALPAALRRKLEEHEVTSLVLNFQGGAVWGWQPEVFDEVVEAPLRQLDQFDPDVQDFEHAVLGTCEDVELDGNGRIRIPTPLRELAELDREVVVNSILDRIEIWDRARWEQRRKEALVRASSGKGMPGRPS